jgi:Icc protein
MSDVLLTFVHISDTHIALNDNTTFRRDHYSERMMKWLEEARAGLEEESSHANPPVLPSVANKKLVEEINRLPFDVDFVLHTGDIMTDPEPDEYTAVKEIMDELRFPIHYLMGNHDSLEGVQRILYGSDEIKPTHDFVFDVNGVQVVGLDSATHGVDHGGNLSEAQLAWLEDICTADDVRPMVVGVHHVLQPLGNKLVDFFQTQNGDVAHSILMKAGHRLRGVFSGHIHQAIDLYEDGILYSFAPGPISQGNLFPGKDGVRGHQVDPSPGFSVVTVTTQRTYIRRYSYLH